MTRAARLHRTAAVASAALALAVMLLAPDYRVSALPLLALALIEAASAALIVWPDA